MDLGFLDRGGSPAQIPGRAERNPEGSPAAEAAYAPFDGDALRSRIPLGAALTANLPREGKARALQVRLN